MRNQIVSMQKVSAKFLRINELLGVNPNTVCASMPKIDMKKPVPVRMWLWPHIGQPTKLGYHNCCELEHFQINKDRGTWCELLSKLILDLNLSCSERILKRDIQKFGLGHWIEWKQCCISQTRNSSARKAWALTFFFDLDCK